MADKQSGVDRRRTVVGRSFPDVLSSPSFAWRIGGARNCAIRRSWGGGGARPDLKGLQSKLCPRRPSCL